MRVIAKSLLASVSIAIPLCAHAITDVSLGFNTLPQIRPTDRPVPNSFGRAVAIDGDVAIIGAPNEEVFLPQPTNIPDTGAAYIFERDPVTNTWSQSAKLLASDATPCHQFGRAVAIRGNVAIVGRSANTQAANCPAVATGKVYVFERTTSGWTEVAQLVPPATVGSNAFPYGAQLAFDGQRLVVTGRVANGYGAYVFERNNNGSWSAPTALMAGGAVVNDPLYAGPTVGLFSSRVILGDGTTADPATRQAHATIFQLNANGIWRVVADLSPGGLIIPTLENAHVSIAGNRALVNEFIYERNTTGVWAPAATLAPAQPAGVVLGASLGLEGTAVLTARGGVNSSIFQTLHVFQRAPDGTWGQIYKLGSNFFVFPTGVVPHDTTRLLVTLAADNPGPNERWVGVSEAPWAQFSRLSLGNRRFWTELNPERWTVIADTDSRYAIVTSQYQRLSGNRLGEYSLVNDTAYGDFRFTAEAMSDEDLGQNPAADYAVVFGYQGPNNYYYMMFNYDPSLTQLFRVVDGRRQLVATATGSAFLDNNYHTIEVARTGTLITVSFGGTQILSVNDSTFGAGRVGIGSSDDAARFDDVVIDATP
jgi:hypothetical protein